MSSGNFNLYANIVDLINRRIGYGLIQVEKGKVAKVELADDIREGESFILPGFIDAHVHIESSMLTPPAFASIAVRHGTVATVSDPHEIANVCGMKGVRYIVDLGRSSGFRFFFGAPSCVPATSFETAGDRLALSDINELFTFGYTNYLAEMMNYPAVLVNDPL